MTNIIVIAGTSDAREIVERLAGMGVEITATVTTKYGGELIGKSGGVEVVEGKLSSKEMFNLINGKNAKCLIDASHPFAREASLNAIEACRRADIPYLRFERSGTQVEGISIIKVKDFNEAAQKADEIEGNIFLTTGSNTLGIFTSHVSNFKERLYARVLPDSGIIAKCEELGLLPGNIIAMKGPFSEEMNIQMLKHVNAAVLVTKDSGDAGGTAEKLEAAASLGIPAILIERPEIVYTEEVKTIDELVERVRCLSDVGKGD